MSTEYESLVNRIMSLRRFGKKKGIDVSSEMLDALGRPEKDMKVIHVAQIAKLQAIRLNNLHCCIKPCKVIQLLCMLI